MLTHVPGYNVTTDNIRSKTVKDSYVKWDAGVLVNAVTTTNSSLTLDNSHDSFYINNANAATISVTILNTINDYTANGNNSLRRVNVIIDSRSAASDRTVTFTIPSTFTLLGGLSATRNLYHGNLQVFVVEIVNNTVNIYDGVGSYFEADSNGDLMPLNSSADLVPRTDLTGQLGTGDKRWAAVYAGNITNTYDNVADMISDTSLKEGGTAFTKGYHNPNDGGSGVYNIRACGSGEPESCDNGSTIFLTNGNVAELITDGTVNVKQFGAVGDGDSENPHDDTTAIQKCLDFATEKGIKAVGEGTFLVTDTIHILCDCDFSLMTITATAADVSPVVRVGNALTDTSSRIYNKTFYLPIVHNSNKPTLWSGIESCIGVECANLYMCVININNILFFGIGLRVTAYGGNGCVNNQFFVKNIYDNMVNLLLEPSDTSAWVNENVFVGGDYSHAQSQGTNVSGCRCIMLSAKEGEHNPNNNLFLKPNVEGKVADYDVWVNGLANTFISPRFEDSPKINYHAETGQYTQYNLFMGGYSAAVYTISGSGTIHKNGAMATGTDTVIPGKTRLTTSSGGDLALAVYSGENGDVIAANLTAYAVRLSRLGIGVKQEEAGSYERFLVNNFGQVLMGSGTKAPSYGFSANDTVNRINVIGATNLTPSTDDSCDLGNASLRYKNIYASNGTIQTSDEREKQDIEPIDDAVFRAWAKVNFMQFRFRDAVAKKGENARIHFGLIAQQVKEAFESEGLDAFKYGLLCYDEWDDEYEDVENEDGTKEHKQVQKAGNRYGIRYDEALALECAYQRWMNKKA